MNGSELLHALEDKTAIRFDLEIIMSPNLRSILNGNTYGVDLRRQWLPTYQTVSVQNILKDVGDSPPNEVQI